MSIDGKHVLNSEPESVKRSGPVAAILKDPGTQESADGADSVTVRIFSLPRIPDDSEPL
jgi:hypothetical protein